MKIAIGCGAVLLLVGGMIAAFWCWDVWQDQRHTVTVVSETPVFAGSGSNACEDASKLTVIKESAVFKAKRIRYWKDCATVDVALRDGRKGYFVLGIGNISVDPPLR